MKKHNILLIHADQHRADCIGAYGNRQIKTPAIDRLARDGVLYENSYCSYPICTPSRYSLISGLYVHQHLCGDNHTTLPDGIQTFPKLLRQEGYNTTCVGKMHFAPTYLDVGFDRMYLCEQVGPGRLDDDFHRELKEEGICDWVDTADQMGEHRPNAPEFYWKNFGILESDLDEAHHSTTWIGNKAMDILNTWEGDGNMLMVGFVKPHHPFDPPYPYSEMYRPEDIELLPGYTPDVLERDMKRSTGFFSHADYTEADIKKCTAMYYGAISQIDFQVNRMISLLKEKGMYDDCMVIYTSDHGDYMGWHHMIGKINYMYEPLAKVPLIVKYPGNERAGTHSQQMVSNVDVAPTILAQASIAPTYGMVGRDLSREQEVPYLFAQDCDGYLVRDERYKLLLCKQSASLLFDLQEDPHELHNLYDDPNYSQVQTRLKDALANWMLFDTPRPLNLNEHAKLCGGDNPRNAFSGHREEMLRYFDEGFAKIPEKFLK